MMGTHRVIYGPSQVLCARRVEASHADATILGHVDVVILRHVLHLYSSHNTCLSELEIHVCHRYLSTLMVCSNIPIINCGNECSTN